MYRFVIAFCKNILHALSFEGTTDIMSLALVKICVRIPEAAAHFCVAVSRALNTFSAIALRATGIVALAISFSFQHSPSLMSPTFSPASEYLVGYFKDNFSASTRHVFEIALANNNNLQQLGQSITISNVQAKPNQPLSRRTPLLLTYKSVEVEKEPSTTEPSSEDLPVALKLATIQLADVGTTSATAKTLEAKRPQPLLLITYKSVEVDETSATKKEGSDEKPQVAEPLTENPAKVEDASEEQLVDVSETSAFETPEDQPSTPVHATHDDLVEVEEISAPEAPPTAPSTSFVGWRKSSPEDDLDDFADSGIDLGDEHGSEVSVEGSADDIDFLAKALAAVTLQDEAQLFAEEVASESSVVVATNPSTRPCHLTGASETAAEEVEAAMEVDEVDLKRGRDELDDGTEPVYTRRFTKSRKIFSNSSVATGFEKFCQRMASDDGPYRSLRDFRQRVGRNARDQADQERRRNAVLKAKRAARIRHRGALERR